MLIDQAIIWTIVCLLLILPLQTNFSENLCRYLNILIQENAYENVFCIISAILSRPQRVSPWTKMVTTLQTITSPILLAWTDFNPSMDK